jgi:hypothetical protein
VAIFFIAKALYDEWLTLQVMWLRRHVLVQQYAFASAALKEQARSFDLFVSALKLRDGRAVTVFIQYAS